MVKLMFGAIIAAWAVLRIGLTKHERPLHSLWWTPIPLLHRALLRDDVDEPGQRQEDPRLRHQHDEHRQRPSWRSSSSSTS
jgi:hypothetical protein